MYTGFMKEHHCFMRICVNFMCELHGSFIELKQLNCFPNKNYFKTMPLDLFGAFSVFHVPCMAQSVCFLLLNHMYLS